jgi:uncharacterized protein YeaO (DUF488 family)
MIKLKRAYESPSTRDGSRFLVDRLWPRGIRKANLEVEACLKDLGPSVALRRWFGHDPKKWDVFRKRYFAELDANPEEWKRVVKAARRGTITLIYSSRDADHNNAVALKDYLQAKIK